MAELDGRPVTAAQLQVLALTNYGHFTTMLVEDGRVRGLDLHLERLERDCAALFGVRPDRERVRGFARRAVPAAGAVAVRVTVFDPAIDLGSIGGKAEPRVLVTARPAGSGVPGPIRVRTARFERELPEVKSVALFGALRQRRLAQQAGFDDALFVDRDGGVTEGGTWNVGFLRGGEPLWPRGAYLAGTAMALLRGACGGAEERVGPELAGVDAVFATNAAVGVRPVAAVDGRAFDTAGVARLREAYLAVPGERL
ncbi:aminotransferase class IV [Kitasatospora fiedleri]|uniref:aminotransferase class IV n=1 Tax=Kitasatospora fiedleri TaxID=2991545 RepID=UPI00249B2455|nr:aminotransferase class IV [Kitasatospora fiedleri]